MKLKINKISDLSSISVLPPQSRRPSGPENSIFGKTQASSSTSKQSENAIFGRTQASAAALLRSQSQQSENSVFGKTQASASPLLRSQASQQSLSQGISSQHGLFSQPSLNSLEDNITNEQRFHSQERENSVKRHPCIAPVNYPQDECQVQMSRSSANLMRKWSTPEQKCQISERLEHRIGMTEASLSRMSIMLESIQTDIIQVNKGTKEILLEMQGARQKMVAHDDFLQLMNKGQEDIKSRLNRGFKALSAKMLGQSSSESSYEIPLAVLALPRKIETLVLKLQRDIEKTISKEMQALSCSLQASNKKCAIPVVRPPKATEHILTSRETHPLKSLQFRLATKVPKTETGGWKSVRRQEATPKDRNPVKNSHLKGVSMNQQERKFRLLDESDEDIEEDSFCFKETDIGSNSKEQAKDATEGVLTRASKKRKRSSTIFID